MTGLRCLLRGTVRTSSVSPTRRDDTNAGTRLERALKLIRHGGKALRAIVGAPDYEAYADRLAAVNPEAIPVTRAEFAAQQMESRFSRSGSRCC